tara:strand:+ start:220 stop:879 length:660 start_codon:yes stop_codon:yes gene_type:complete
MAITIGNKTQANPTPGASFYQLAHNQNTGSDGFLIVAAVMSNSRTLTTATYGGDAMDYVFLKAFNGLGQYTKFWVLENPKTGSNTLRINFSGTQWNPISIYAKSFTGAQAGGNSINLGGASTPRSSNITLSSGSLVYAYGISINAVSGVQIPTGTATGAEFTHNTNRQVRGGLNTSSFSAGTVQIRTTSTSGSVTLQAYEIQEKATAGGGGENNFFLIM